MRYSKTFFLAGVLMLALSACKQQTQAEQAQTENAASAQAAPVEPAAPVLALAEEGLRDLRAGTTYRTEILQPMFPEFEVREGEIEIGDEMRKVLQVYDGRWLMVTIVPERTNQKVDYFFVNSPSITTPAGISVGMTYVQSAGSTLPCQPGKGELSGTVICQESLGSNIFYIFSHGEVDAGDKMPSAEALSQAMITRILWKETKMETPKGFDNVLRTQVPAGYTHREAFLDLNGDGRTDALVLLTGPQGCSSGDCSLLILEGTGSSFRTLSKIPSVLPPMQVVNTKTGRWYDLAVRTAGGTAYLLRNEGKNYPQDMGDLPPLADMEKIQGKILFK